MQSNKQIVDEILVNLVFVWNQLADQLLDALP
jgi:hypothetical protein